MNNKTLITLTKNQFLNYFLKENNNYNKIIAKIS